MKQHARAAYTGTVWAVDRAFRIIVTGGVFLGADAAWDYFIGPSEETSMVMLSDATLTQFAFALIPPIMTAIYVWHIVGFKEGNKE